MKYIALALLLPLCAALDVAARRYVLAENASKFYTELDNRPGGERDGARDAERPHRRRTTD